MYTIVYHVQYTYTCKRVHPQRTSSRGKARVPTKVGPTSRRAERAASAAERPALKAPDTPTYSRDPRTEVGEEVGVRVGPVEFSYKETHSLVIDVSNVLFVKKVNL